MSYFPDLAPRLLSNVTDFPVQALGPVLMPPVVQLHLETGIAVETVAAVALTVAHTAIQDLVDVQRPDCPPSPCGAVHLVISSAGEGLERAISAFLAPLRDFESKNAQAAHDNRYRFEAEMKAWSAKERALTKRMNEAAEDDDDLTMFEAEYEELAAHRPTSQIGTRIIIGSPSAEALTKNRWTGSESALLIEPHIESLLGSKLGKLERLIGSIYDCQPQPTNANSSALSNISCRASALFGARPASYRKYLNRQIDSAAGSEILSSMLTTWSHSTVGFCYQQAAPFPSTMPPTTEVATRLSRLLERGRQRRVAGLPREALPFTLGAANDYRAILNMYQHLSGPGQILNGTTGMASKAPEHVGRKACMLHCLEGRTGAIEFDVLARANLIIQWFVNQNYFALSPGQFGDQREIDAQAVAAALDRASSHGFERVSRSELLQWCHSEMTAQRFRAAWQLLAKRNQVVVSQRGSVTFLSPTPALSIKPDWPFPNKTGV